MQIYLRASDIIKPISDSMESKSAPQINDLGQVAWREGVVDARIVLYQQGATKLIYHAGGPPFSNNQGQVVGSNNKQVFLYQPDGSQMQITQTDPKLGNGQPRINDRGWIAWYGYGDSATLGIFLATPAGSAVPAMQLLLLD